MKYLKLLLTLTLLVSVVGTVAFAGKSSKNLSTLEQKRLRFEGELTKSRPVSQEEAETSEENRAILQAEKQTREASAGFRKGTRNAPLSIPSSPVTIMSLSGDYEVGAGKDFFTLHEAVAVLNNATVAGAVRFLLTDETYTEDYGLSLGVIDGASAENTVTFQPASTVTHVTITLKANDDYGGGWAFWGTQYITINGTKDGGTEGDRNLTIEYDDTQALPGFYDAPIHMYDNSFATLENLILNSQVGSTYGVRGILLDQTSETTPVHDITIDNCEVTEAGRAIFVWGWWDFEGGVQEADLSIMSYNITVTNNWIHDVYDSGIYFEGVRNSTIKGNTIERVSTPSGFGSYRTNGVYLNGSMRTTIENNRINDIHNYRTVSASSNRTYGIRILAPGGYGSFSDPDDAYTLLWAAIPTYNRITQNTISEIRAESNNFISNIGISTEGSRHDTAAHNSIYMTGASSPGGILGFYTYGNVLQTSRLRCYNNAVAIDRASSGGGTVGAIRSLDIAGNDYRAPSDYNVYYVTTGSIMQDLGLNTIYDLYANYGQGSDAHSVAGNPFFMSSSDLHIDSTTASSASNLGKPYPQVPVDLDGAGRDASTPDAGAFEFGDAVATTDVAAISVDNPGAAGIPEGLPFTGFSATIRNENQYSVTGASVTFKVYNTTMTEVFTETQTGIDLDGFEIASVDFANSFTPSGSGGFTFEVTVSAPSDAVAGNDVVSSVLPVAGQVVAPFTNDFNDAGDLDGWFLDGDFVSSSTFTKLGGPYDGKSLVTEDPHDAAHYSTGGVVSHIYTPYLDMTGMSTGFISFFHSINLEPAWDRSIMEYSVDTGRTWMRLGDLDDAAGVNWYSTSVYKNALTDDGCIDDANWNLRFPDYELPQPGWASNDNANDGVGCAGGSPSGPNGYVYVQLDLSSADPSPLGKSYVRFRYSAFSDASATVDGWAVDNFAITATAPNFGGSIAGTVKTDANGDGNIASDAALAGVTVNLAYFGVASASTTTDGSGSYSFLGLNPGDYTVSVDADGYYISAPIDGEFTIAHDGQAASTGNDFGLYEGSISGNVFSDTNNDGTNDSEPGLSGWTVNVYADSSTTLVSSQTTPSGGAYSITAGPGLYTVAVTQLATGRPTMPGTTEETNSYLVSVGGTSGSGTALVTGKDFGQFIYGTLRIELTIDLDGDGVKDAGDVAGLPGTNLGTFEVTKNGDLYTTVTVGATSSNTTITGLDLGTYAVTQTAPSGWSQTSASGSTSYTLATSSRKDTARFLDFDHIDISGTKFNDTDGDGVKDEGEAGLSGWTITLSGTGGGSTVTDGDGNYSFTEVGGGAHTLSETQQSGWTVTTPSGGSYTITMLSGTNQTGKNFGNFQNVSISGTKYRDRNNNGNQDAGEEGLAGWTINLDGVTGDQSTVTGTNGAYSFSNVGPGTYTVSEEAQSGWTNTEPEGGTYSVTTASGSNVTGKDFGNFQEADESNLYFTFEASTLEASATAKDKVVKAGKGEPTISNILNQLISKTSVGTVVVGKAAQMLGGKEKRYIVPASFKDVQKTLVDKSGVHDGDPQGLGIDPKGKLMLKKVKALPPAKAENVLIANQLALKINIALSDSGYTTEGFGDLIYSNEDSDFDTWTVAEIAAYVDDIMTNWNTTDPSVYEDANAVVAELNDSFTGDFDTVATATAGVYNIAGIRSVTEVGYLKAPVGTPRVRPTVPPVTQLPDVYSLEQNYPNPFNPSTTIEFMLPTDAIVTLKIYNMLGQEVATVVDNEQIEAGEISYDFDASSLSSGVYLYRVVAQSLDANEDGVPANFTEVKKMTLIK